MEVVQVNDSRIHRVYRFIKSIVSGDSHESFQIGPFGDDSVPPKGLKAVRAKTTTNGVDVIVGYFNKKQISEVGERRFYSLKPDGSEGFYVYLKNDGTCEIGGTGNYLVRYNELKEGFDQLRSDMNDLISKYNLHTHPVAGSLASATSSTQLQSTADISGSKINEIQTL